VINVIGRGVFKSQTYCPTQENHENRADIEQTF
jgi:hypothetical protein